MKDMFQRLKSGSGGDTAVPRLTLGAFGKHPGWDDHILGIGGETETLARAKQLLYVGGIGGQIDSGAWERLEAEKRLAGFEHTFLWLRPGHVITGQLWSSTDGKGRSKYPMVLCIDGEGVAPGYMLSTLLPGLERLKDACKSASTADQVTASCRAAQDQLRTMLNAASAQAPEEPSLDARRKFLVRPELGPDALGFLRVLHEIGSGPALSARGGAPGSRHLRVPQAGESRDEALTLWAFFLRGAVPDATPLLLIARNGAEWLDIVLGEPVSDDFFCLQASAKAIPLATEIPYALSPDLKTRFAELQAKFLGLRPPPPAAPSIPGKTAPPALPPQAAPEKRRRWPLWFGGASLLIILIGVAVWKLAGNSRSTPTETAAIKTANPPSAAAPAPAPAPAATGAAAQPEDGQAYQTALANAQAARRKGDYSNAIAQLGVALQTRPGDAAATRMLSEVEDAAFAAASGKKYQDEIASSQAAFAQGDFQSASNQAFLALAARPGDAAALALMEKSKQALARSAAAAGRDSAYQTALVATQSALASGNLDAALAHAQEMLAARPGDALAATLAGQARQRKAGLPSKAAAAAASVAPAGAVLSKPPFTNSLGMEFVWLPAACIGGAYVAKYEVTQKQFRSIMGKLPAGLAVQQDDLPVWNITAQDARDFCDRLGKRDGYHYSLPAAPEWLGMAGLSSNQAPAAWSILAADGRLRNEVTSWNISPGLTQPALVGSKGPQANGLCDLLGNVREWVTDKDGDQSAGFAYDAAGGYTTHLFLESSARAWVQSSTGFRCILRDNP